MAAFGWKLVCDGRTPPPGEVVRPAERLSSLRMAGLGAQHVVAMFGAKIWIENRVYFADPVNLVPLAGGIIAGIGNLAAAGRAYEGEP